ncbi:MAG: hypothetical protein JOZ17_12835 [Acetobacteraceae bacterium]|nr:hypothetical protein [Acetobacteraceae bacterium]
MLAVVKRAPEIQGRSVSDLVDSAAQEAATAPDDSGFVKRNIIGISDDLRRVLYGFARPVHHD